MNSQHKAQLQTLGIDIYEPIASIDVSLMPWLKDVCALLEITPENCVFDSSTVYFDDNSKQLHLPATFYSSEMSLKRMVWLNIQQWAST